MNDNVVAFGANRYNTARVWASMMIEFDNDDTYVPNYKLSSAAPDYLTNLVRDCHDAFGLEYTDDYTMFFVRASLESIADNVSPGQLVVFDLQDESPDSAKHILSTYPGMVKEQYLSEWLNMDHARFTIVANSERINGRPMGDEKLEIMLEDAMNYELKKVHMMCLESIDKYLGVLSHGSRQKQA